MSAGYVACFVLPLLLFYDHSLSTPYFYEVILWITYPYSASCASAIVYWLAAGMSPNARPVCCWMLAQTSRSMRSTSPPVSGVGRFTDADPGAGEFIPSLLDNCWLAIAATDNETVNQQVSDAAEARRIFCNVVDAPRQASFIMPSIIDRSPLMVAVSSGGTSPVLARLLREKLESILPLHLGQLARYAGHLRAR
jgi:hypothetical protein